MDAICTYSGNLEVNDHEDELQVDHEDQDPYEDDFILDIDAIQDPISKEIHDDNIFIDV